MSKIDELRGKVAAAYNVKKDVETRRDARKYELDEKTAYTLEAAFGDELRAARAAEQAALNELQEAEHAERIKNVKLPYPEGTVLLEWKPVGWGAQRELSGKRAVVQIFRQGDVLPKGVKWSSPSVGYVVLRELKKGGDVGKAVTTWYDSMLNFWLPEGQNPKK